MKKLVPALAVLSVLSLAGCVSFDQSNSDPAHEGITLQNHGQDIQFITGKDSAVTFKPPSFANAGDFGLLSKDNNGYDEMLWDGVDATLASDLPMILPVKAGHDAFKTMLLTAANAPDGTGTDWLKARIQTLLWMGEHASATKLAYASLRGRDADDRESADIIQLLFANKQKDAACLEALGNTSADTNLRTMRALCFAMLGQKNKAGALWSDTRISLPDDPAVSYIDALLDGEPLPEFPHTHPLRTVLAAARNVITGQNGVIPEPLFIQDDMNAWQAKQADRDHTIDTDSIIAQFNDAAAKKQEGRVALLMYSVANKAKQSHEELDPYVMDAAIAAWQAVGLTDSAKLKAELVAIEK